MRGPMTAQTLSARYVAGCAVTAGTIVAALALGACGSDDGGGEEPSPLEDPAVTEASPEAPAPEGGGGSLSRDEEQAVARATRGYVAAINADDGSAVCATLAAGALEGAGLPREGPSCAASVERSIGHRGGGGTPVWRRTRLHELTAVEVQEGRARVTATVSHDFSDRPEPSVEEDVIYLDRVGEEWLIAKPSASFYRAIGYPEPPLRALTPP